MHFQLRRWPRVDKGFKRAVFILCVLIGCCLGLAVIDIGKLMWQVYVETR
jgi:hypothetical protein